MIYKRENILLNQILNLISNAEELKNIKNYYQGVWLSTEIQLSYYKFW